MSERFGLDLDMSAVRLVSWQDGDWHEIAKEKIDGPDIEDRLLAMVSRIDPANPVELFLPRDQILYSDISISGTPTRDQIASGLDGLTPYALDDLSFDFEILAPGKARVAVIARDTLDEALAFAEVRGLRVTGYSSLADPADFPRNPDFGTLEHAFEAETDIEPVGDTPVQFASNRAVQSAPETEIAARAAEPVLLINDDTPVMQVETKAPPLDPGMPINAVPPKPRVTTDISASTHSGLVADSLTPNSEPSLKLRRPSTPPLRTALIFAAAALLTIAIAAVVWSILPLAPEKAGVRDDVRTNQTDVAQTPPEPEPTIPDLPLPDTWIDIAGFTAPSPPKPQPAAPVAGTTPARMTSVTLVESDVEEFPRLSTTTPLAPPPVSIARIAITAPFPGPTPADQDLVPLDSLYIASIEQPDHSYDPFALPSGANLTDSLPIIGAAPLPWSEQPVATAIASLAEATETTEDQIGALLPPSPEAHALEQPGVPWPTPDTPVTAETEPETPPQTTPITLRPTELAASLPDETPKPRPRGLLQMIERDKFGGRTLAQLELIKPSPRPASEQMQALQERAGSNASELAVARSIVPRDRPDNFDAVAANIIAQREAARVAASLSAQTPDTSAAVEAALSEEPGTRPQDTPRLAIPSSASVARQATVEDAIRLNRVNLVGVYGVPSDRRALVRLKNGRYVKVKVGDKVDGGVVAQITDSQLHYKKGSRLVTLSLPQG